jgi:NAD(P)-dependent dehydrogenase (short-subunit alcohol dehydrogenase family)
MADALRLFGMRAVITNAAGGIGEAIARTLVKHGAEVLAVDTANSGVETHFKSVRGIRGAVLDLFAPDGAADLAELAATELGVVDIIVCDVTPATDALINDQDADALDKLLQRKHDLVSDICHKLLPLMKNSPGGRVIILGFLRSVFGVDGSNSFRKSQSSIADFTAGLAAETGEFGVNANYIQPGAIMTPESRRVFKSDKALRDFCIGASAAKRLGDPVDVAKVALFLATDDSVFVSGTGIVVDGGIAADS